MSEGIQYKIEQDEVVVTGFIGDYEGVITIPSEIDGVKVIRVDGFQGGKELRNYDGTTKKWSLVIEEGTKSIMEGSFDRLNIGSLSLPDSLHFIGDAAFSFNYIKELILPENVRSVGRESFLSCFIRVLTLPKSISVIRESAFKNNRRLEVVVLPDSLETIGANAFAKCGIKELKIGESVISIGEGAFRNNFLEEVTTPDSLKKIHQQAFQRNNISKINFGEGLNLIGDSSFGNNNIKAVRLPKSLKTLMGRAFVNNELSFLELPKNVRIGSWIPDEFSDNIKSLFVNEGSRFPYGLLGRKMDLYTDAKHKNFSVVNGIQTNIEYLDSAEDFHNLCELKSKFT